MALAANAKYKVRSSVQIAPQAANAAAIYNGAYMAIGNRAHGTSASRGRAFPWTSAAHEIPAGFSISRETGDTSASPIPDAKIDTDSRVIKSLAVTGLAGTVADVGRKVYASDDGTFTFTRPAAGFPIGVVVRHQSSTLCDVYFFSFGELCAIGLAGGGQQTVLLGIVNGIESAGNHATGIPMSGHGRILSVYGIVFEPMTDADSTATFNLEIDTVDVTGGVITWATADVLGDKKAGTAITAANVFHEGSVIDIECAAGTAGTAADGYMAIYAIIENELGI